MHEKAGTELLRLTCSSTPAAVASQFVREELQGNIAAQFGVLGSVDHTHAATAQFLCDAIVRNHRTDHGRRGNRAWSLWSASNAKRARLQHSIIRISAPCTTSRNTKCVLSLQWSFWKARR